MKYALFGLFCVLAWGLRANYEHTAAMFIGACTIALLINRSHINIVSWILIVMVFRALEVLVFSTWDLSKHPYWHYTIQLLFNFGVIICIHYRWRLYYRLEKKAQIREVYATNADFMLMLVYVLYALVVFAAMAEHLFLRHPYDIGLPADWKTGTRVIYDAYEELKLTVNLIECLILLSAFSSYHRSARFVSA